MSIETAGGTHPAQRAVAVIDAALADLLSVSPWSLTDGEQIDLMAAQERVLARLHASVLAITRDFDARGTAAAQGATGTGRGCGSGSLSTFLCVNVSDGWSGQVPG